MHYAAHLKLRSAVVRCVAGVEGVYSIAKKGRAGNERLSNWFSLGMRLVSFGTVFLFCPFGPTRAPQGQVKAAAEG